jgi:hypothetical protein
MAVVPTATPLLRQTHQDSLQPSQGTHDRLRGRTMQPGPCPVCHPAGHVILLAQVAHHDRITPTGSVLDLRAHLQPDPGVSKLVAAVTVPREGLLALSLGQLLDLLLVLGNGLPCSRLLSLAISIRPLQGIRKFPFLLQLMGRRVGLALPRFLYGLLRGRGWHCLMTLLGDRPPAEDLVRPFELDRCHDRDRRFALEKEPGYLPSDTCANGEDRRCNAGGPELARHACVAHSNSLDVILVSGMICADLLIYS